VTNARLIVAIVTTLLDDVLILLLLLIGLPYFGIYLPLTLIIGIALVWIGFSVFLYVVGSKVMKKKPLAGFTDMVNTQGIVVRAIAPNGMVKIKGELWSVKSAGETITKGEQVIVTGQNNMELTVIKYTEKDN
jgi:membrane protein implicated in regulation of membrane protease activity